MFERFKLVKGEPHFKKREKMGILRRKHVVEFSKHK